MASGGIRTVGVYHLGTTRRRVTRPWEYPPWGEGPFPIPVRTEVWWSPCRVLVMPNSSGGEGPKARAEGGDPGGRGTDAAPGGVALVSSGQGWGQY